MEKITSLFAQTVELLKSTSDVVVSKAIINEPASIELIHEAEALMKMPLSEEMKAFFLTANGLTIEWSVGSIGDENFLYGWIDIWPLEKVIAGEDADMSIDDERLKFVFEEMLMLDDLEDDVREELTKHRVLESHWGNSSYTTIRFDAKDGLSLYYVDYDGQYALPLSFQEYITFVFEILGIDGGRYGLKEADFYKNPYSNNAEVQKVKSKFPTTDLSKIKAFASLN